MKRVYYFRKVFENLISLLQNHKRKVTHLVTSSNENPNLLLINKLLRCLYKRCCVKEHFEQELLPVKPLGFNNQKQVSKYINFNQLFIILIKGLEFKLPLSGTFKDIFELFLHSYHFSHMLLILQCLIRFFHHLMIRLYSFGQCQIVRMISPQFLLIVGQ